MGTPVVKSFLIMTRRAQQSKLLNMPQKTQGKTKLNYRVTHPFAALTRLQGKVVNELCTTGTITAQQQLTAEHCSNAAPSCRCRDCSPGHNLTLLGMNDGPHSHQQL